MVRETGAGGWAECLATMLAKKNPHGKVAKLNIDDNQATPSSYGVRGIPTLMLFKNGNIEATKVGALSKSQLSAFIDSHL